eukprot:CAMPEP_0179420688 /NCGR_PEP_ID=MMETSP0799-20121207/9314_1 /TAXON_ID=46947 /ORGANISM="Geminigera cryophila, Strain CCMP2564" /LENGTH=94 /DNA_ID=CAMNT_0021194341 /DNA_START=1 /DNA_END=281 /DNA_ORIENTATION=+
MAGKLIDVRHKESAKWQCKLQQEAQMWDSKIDALKQTANSTAHELRAQVRAAMVQEEERDVAETARLAADSHKVASLQNLLHRTQRELAHTQEA